MRSLAYIGFFALLAVHLAAALDVSAWASDELEDDVNITDVAVLKKDEWLNTFLYSKEGGRACKCVKKKCTCCAKHKYGKKVFGRPLKYTLDVCMTVKYLKHNNDIKLNFKINGYELCNKKISLKNPPALCYSDSRLKATKVCLKFFGMKFKRKSIDGCATITGSVKLFMIKTFKVSIHLGCFKLPIDADEAHASRHRKRSLTMNTQDAQGTDVYFPWDHEDESEPNNS